MLYGYLNSSFVSNPFSDAAIPPTSLTSPVVSGSGVVGQTLSTTNGTWSGTLPITYSYQWNRNGSIILGATFNTYTLVIADGSTSITCTVTATNAGGFASSTSNAISVAAAGDADANAFIAAAAITDRTQQSAIEKLVVDLKGYGIWTKMKAIYPFVGGVASSHKFNLRNPLDTDAAFRLVFNGGWVHSNTGALPNGTNAWANTYFKSGTNFTSKDNAHYSFYSRTNLASTSVEIGSDEAPANQVLHTRHTDGKAYFALNSGPFTSILVPNSLGFYQSNRILTNTLSGWKNGIKLSEISSSSVISNVAWMAISAYNNALNAPSNYSSKECAFASFGDGLTDTDAANYYTAVQTFQTTLGRNVGVPIVADSDAQAFLNAAVIEDVTQANAVNTLVTDLKGYGIWTKMKAIYPFIGGTAAQHKFNLRSPLDTDAAFRLVFNGGWTHSSTGALPNGTNAFADTKLNLLTHTTQNSLSLSYYSRTNLDANGFYVFAGAFEAPNYFQFFQYQNSTYYDTYDAQVYGGRIIVPNTKTYGNFLGNRLGNTKQLYLNSTKILPTDPNVSQGQGGARPNLNVYLAAMNTSGNVANFFSNLQCAFASIGDGLTDTEAANYYTAVQTFQTTLGRQV